uniref:Ran-binding protein n=1 Tax=Strongyloides venezuelensis TaxID=75913 RepID=A0A0K0G2B4_STRVS
MDEECDHVRLNTFQLLFIDSPNQKESLKVAGNLLLSTTNKMLQDTTKLPCIECLKCITSILLDFNNLKPIPINIFKEEKWPKELGKVLERIVKTKNIEYNYIKLVFQIIPQLFYLSNDSWLQGNDKFLTLIVSLCEVRLRMVLGEYDKIEEREVEDVCDVLEFVVREIENGNYMDSLATKLSLLIQKSISFLCEWIHEVYIEKLTINSRCEEKIYQTIVDFFSIGGGEMIETRTLKEGIEALQSISLRYLKEDISKGRSLVCILTNCPSLPDTTLKYLLEYYNTSPDDNYKNKALDDLGIILEEFKDRCDFYNITSLKELKTLSLDINDIKIKEIIENM